MHHRPQFSVSAPMFVMDGQRCQAEEREIHSTISGRKRQYSRKWKEMKMDKVRVVGRESGGEE